MRMSKTLLQIAALGILIGNDKPVTSRNYIEEEIDIKKEYELIKQKKSTLSRSKREKIIKMVERT